MSMQMGWKSITVSIGSAVVLEGVVFVSHLLFRSCTSFELPVGFWFLTTEPGSVRSCKLAGNT